MIILNSKILGIGSPLLILHGLFGMSDNWRYIGKILSKKYQVHLLDIRNHGKSIQSNDMDYLILSNDILNYINFYKLFNIILIGHSMGGKIAMQFALNYPNLINKIIIVDISPKKYPPYHIDIINILKMIDIKKIKNRQNLNNYLSKFDIDINTKMLILKNLYRKNDNSFEFLFYLPGIEKNYFHLNNNIIKTNIYNKKIFFLRGINSNYISINDDVIIKEYFPLSKIITLNKVGHCMHYEDPIKFINIINNILNIN